MISNKILEVEIEIAVEDKLVPKYMQHVRCHTFDLRISENTRISYSRQTESIQVTSIFVIFCCSASPCSFYPFYATIYLSLMEFHISIRSHT